MTATVTGLILSGGRGSRMGGVDKGLQTLHGRMLVEWVLERLEPQVAELLISANDNLERYLALGYPVVHDRVAGFAGPLAGLHAGLLEARTDVVVSVPCDSPFLSHDLVARLIDALEREHADLAVARIGDRQHSVFCACRVALAENLAGYLRAGGRQVSAWHATIRTVEVDFADRAECFRNINTLAELRAMESPGDI